MSASDFNIINSVSDSDIICVHQILTLNEFIFLCYSTVNKLHYYITDFLKFKSQTCSLKENMCVIVIVRMRMNNRNV